MSDDPPLSYESVTRAGGALRNHEIGVASLDPFELRKALEVVARFRASWVQPPRPLNLVAVGLHSMTLTLLASPVVLSQRLKRLPRIPSKLSHPEHASMRLPQMEDIGGCRVVLESLPELRALEQRIVVDRWAEELVRVVDYIDTPKADGYRAVHVIVRRDERLVEIQLRTLLQHAWAVQVERLEAFHRARLRRGEAPRDLGTTLIELSDSLARLDLGHALPEVERERISTWLAKLGDRR